MISGWFWPRIEPPPRATTRTEPNGLLEFVTCSPATLPCSSPNTFVLGTCVPVRGDGLRGVWQRALLALDAERCRHRYRFQLHRLEPHGDVDDGLHPPHHGPVPDP